MDAMEYDRQLAERARIHRRNRDLRGSGEYLSGLARRERLAPVMTVVFYYGEEPWDGSRRNTGNISRTTRCGSLSPAKWSRGIFRRSGRR